MQKSNRENGSILLSVLFIVMVAIALVGAAYMATSNQTMQTSRSADVDALESTAEGVLDYAFGKWKASVDSKGLLTASDATALVTGANSPAVPSRMQITKFTITPIDAAGAASTTAVKTYDYRMAFVYTYVASVTIQSSGVGGKREISMRRNLVYTAVPPTNGMFYSQGDFELYNPATMVIGGNVHTNGNGHVSRGSNSVTFQSGARVTYAGDTYDTAAPAGANAWSANASPNSPTYADTLAKQVKHVPEITGIGLGTAAEYDTKDNNPNNDGNRELIEPPVPGYEDPPAIKASRIYNNAGILITVTGIVDSTATLSNPSTGTFTGGNVTIKAQNGTSLTATQATTIRSAITNSTPANTQVWTSKMVLVPETTTTTGSGKNAKTTTTPAHYEDQGSFSSKSTITRRVLYDKRENTSIPITDLNLGAINTTLNTATGFNGILYMYNNEGTADTNNTTKKAIRIQNGGILPDSGLTIATQDGLYVQGDYNTGTNPSDSTKVATKVPSNSSPKANASTVISGYTTKSAALVGDAIMVLSNGWSDSNDSKSVDSRNATNTTLNTAFISGYVASKEGGDYLRSGYSGGMNNFPRFLETWTGDAMTYSGAFVSLYESKNFKTSWDTGDVYVPPTRYWYFDTMLLTRMLPGIPPTGGFVRGPLARF